MVPLLSALGCDAEISLAPDNCCRPLPCGGFKPVFLKINLDAKCARAKRWRSVGGLLRPLHDTCEAQALAYSLPTDR